MCSWQILLKAVLWRNKHVYFWLLGRPPCCVDRNVRYGPQSTHRDYICRPRRSVLSHWLVECIVGHFQLALDQARVWGSVKWPWLFFWRFWWRSQQLSCKSLPHRFYIDKKLIILNNTTTFFWLNIWHTSTPFCFAVTTLYEATLLEMFRLQQSFFHAVSW